MSSVLSVPATTLRAFCDAVVSALDIPAPQARLGTPSIQSPEELASLRLCHDRTQLVLATMRRLLSDREVDEHDLMLLATSLRGEMADCPAERLPTHAPEATAGDVAVQQDAQHVNKRLPVGAVTRHSITYTADTPDGPKRALVAGGSMRRCTGPDRYDALLGDLALIIEDTLMAGGGRADDALLDLIATAQRERA